MYIKTPTLWVGCRTNTTAQDGAAATYAKALVNGATVDQAAGKAQKRMKTLTDAANRNPKAATYYPKPIVCVTEEGKTVCHN
jgi:hypothetical protein